jgi:hypothetical protein
MAFKSRKLRIHHHPLKKLRLYIKTRKKAKAQQPRRLPAFSHAYFLPELNCGGA